MASTSLTPTPSIRYRIREEGGTKPIKEFSSISVKWRRETSLAFSIRALGGDAGNVSNNNVKALEINGVLDDYSSETTCKDSQALPRPLSVSDGANSVNGSRLRVAYQGLPGAYSEAAAAKAYPNCEAVPCELFETAFDAVERWLVDRAVLPIENSLGGSIHRNYDLLLRHKLHIVGEVKYAVRHCLLANPGVKIENLKRVLSHPQALAQCEHTLTKLGVVREAVDDTAGAAQFVSFHKLQDAGAVASSLASEIYGLDILAHDIQDDPDNVTRFLIFAREPLIPGVDKPFKTSIVFSLEEGPGVLFKALAVFAMRDINLTKIESRPQRRKPLCVNDDTSSTPLKYFNYIFYVDFEASMADPNAQNALRHLKDHIAGYGAYRIFAATSECVTSPVSHIWSLSKGRGQEELLLG